MTRPARIQVEPRSQTWVVSGDSLVLIELRESSLKKSQVVWIGADRSERLARVYACVAAYSWIGLGKRDSGKSQRR